jgi:hypothetical protein
MQEREELRVFKNKKKSMGMEKKERKKKYIEE